MAFRRQSEFPAFPVFYPNTRAVLAMCAEPGRKQHSRARQFTKPESSKTRSVNTSLCSAHNIWMQSPGAQLYRCVCAGIRTYRVVVAGRTSWLVNFEYLMSWSSSREDASPASSGRAPAVTEGFPLVLKASAFPLENL